MTTSKLDQIEGGSQAVQDLAKILCRLKHPHLDPGKALPNAGLLDPAWMYYESDAKILLDSYLHLARGRN